MEKPHIGGLRPAVLELEPGEYYWCACGRSKNQPWCDGSHKGTGFSPLRMEITGQQRCALCTCKQSAKAPHCDGTHKRL